MNFEMTRGWGRVGAYVLISLVAATLLAPAAQAQTYLPSIKIGTAALISPAAANTYYGSGTTSSDGLSTLTGTETPTPPEIIELARALKNNPDLIYQYVHNNIQSVWTYGLAKGALGAEIDKSGTPYDQVELMVALLRQSGFSTSYVAGTIVLNQAQFYNWTGITDSKAACQLLSSGGFPAAINGTTNVACSSFTAGTSISTVQMAHIWVQVTIPGSHAAGCSVSDVCIFDPAYKSYVWRTGIPLATAMGFTSGDPLAKATTGSTGGTTSGAPWALTLNAALLNSTMTGYGNNLLAYIQSHGFQGAQMEDIVGGGVIIADMSAVRQSALIYIDPSPPYAANVWTPSADTARYNAIPDQYRTTLETEGFMRVYTTLSDYHDATMFNPTFYADEIYGRRLTVDTDFNSTGIVVMNDYFPNKVTMKLDGQALANVPTFIDTFPPGFTNTTARGLPSHITLIANHPYAASSDGTPTANGTYMDVTIDKTVVLVTPLTIVHSWGDVSAALFKKWSDERAADGKLPARIYPAYCPGGTHDPCPDYYHGPTGDFAREKTAAAWLSQMSRAAQLNGDIANAVPALHHMLGFVYSDSQLVPIYRQTSPAELDEVLSDSFDRIDVDGGISFTSRVADAPTRRAAIQSFATSSATLEGSISGQLSDLPDNSSTATRFEWGNSPPSSVTDPNQNPRGLGAQQFYQFTSATVSAASGLLTSEGYSNSACPANDGIANWTAQPEISQVECGYWIGALNGELTAYANAGFTVVTQRESFLGPGQRGGAIHVNATSSGGQPLNYFQDYTKQRGGAFVATRNDANGDPVEIAHIVIGASLTVDGYTVATKGGGGGNEPDTQKNYNPSEAASILKSRFVDRSNALGVNLSNGSLAYTSPSSIDTGDSDFPYKLSASLTYQPGPPPNPFGPYNGNEPQAGWKTSWQNNLAISGSGMEAMGASDIRAAIGTIVAFYSAQDVYKATQSVQRDSVGPLVMAWWSHQLVGNAATVSHGADSRQFVQLFNGSWILPGAGYATITQTSNRTPYEQLICAGGHNPPYPGARGWDYHTLSFAVNNQQGDVENFGYWKQIYPTTDAAVCGLLQGFQLNSWTFPYGVAVTPSYDPTTGLLTGVSNNVSRSISFSSDGTSHVYLNADTRNVSIAATNASLIGSNVTGTTDPAGKTTTFNYQAPVATSPTQRPVPYPQLSQVFTADNPTQANVDYFYDALGRIDQVKDAVAIQTGGRNPYSFYIADGTRGERDDPLGQAYSVTYDTYGHPSIYVDELGHGTLAYFDSRSRPGAFFYPEGDCDVMGYDDRNNTTDLWRVDTASSCNNSAGAAHVLHTHATWDPTWNKPLTVTNPRGFTTTLVYYPSGNGTSLLHTATRPAITEGTSVYSFTYDARGKPLTAIVPLTSTQTITTSNAFDPTTEAMLSSTLDPSTTPHVNAVTSYTYNVQGDVATTTDPRGNVTSSLYDADRRKTEDDHHNGNVTAALNAAEAIHYDAVGRDIEDDSGTAFSGTTITAWLTTKTTVYTPTSKVYTVTDADNRTTTTLYDNDDRTLTVTDPVSRSTHMVYCAPGDANCAANQVRIELRAWAGSNNNCSVSGTLQECYRTVSYLPDGEQATIADANGNATTYGYDLFTRLTTTTFPDASFEQLALDANGNVTARRNRAAQTLTYAYNALDWMTQKVSPSPALTTNTAYMLDGAADTISDTAGNTVDYGYDTAGRAISEANTIAGLSGVKTTSYTLDANGNRTRLTWPDGYFVNYSYDNLNRMMTAADSVITLATYGYDPLSRRTSLAYTNGATIAYGYSNAGDLLTLSHSFPGSSANVTFTNTFTNAHQLATEAVSNSAYLWQPAANASTPYAAANNLNQYPNVNGVAFGYDAKGNLTSDGVTTYAYDAENRLMTANKTGVAASYAYDPLGRRTAKSVVGSAALWGSVNWGSFNWSAGGTAGTYFVSDGSDEIAEYDGTGALIARTIPGPAIDEPIARQAFNATTFFHTNHQGSVIAMSDASGNRIEGPYTYDPYGDCFTGLSPCGAVGEPYRFTGRRLDPETGLYYYRARYYAADDQRGGRFLQTDPVGYTADLNLYTYAGNDPGDKSDPTGNEAVAELARIDPDFGGNPNNPDPPPDLNNVASAIDFGTVIATVVEIDSGVGIPLAGPTEYEGHNLANIVRAEEGGTAAGSGKTYQTYTKTNPETGEVYSGKTSGYGTPEQNVARRDQGHHMNEKGFGPAKLDKSSGDPQAIKGREQQLIEKNGGAKSQGGTSGNRRNGLGPRNPDKASCMQAATCNFGHP